MLIGCRLEVELGVRVHANEEAVQVILNFAKTETNHVHLRLQTKIA